VRDKLGGHKTASLRGVAAMAAMQDKGNKTAGFWQLVRERRWGAVVVLIQRRAWSTARAEHTLVSMLYPLDVEQLRGNALSDMQSTQIFWNVLMVELVMLTTIYSAPSGGSSSGWSPIRMIIDTFIVVGPACISGMVMQLIFKWGNKGRRVRTKKESAQADMTQVRTRNSESKGPHRARRRRRRRSPHEWKYLLRRTLAWAIILSGYVVCALSLMIFSAQVLGPDNFNSFLGSWGAALITAWCVVEPFEIAVLIVAPNILDNKYVASIRGTLKDLGVY